ncbi:3' terminal RNA ribose 2'-O-methyltransferase Hen1 [Demequina sp. TTPB684]|uniref:3' terminal RNA ribose 2'-O-methyltransferase Hen1 n=1 Tax=unclassified Demequina TaxID=2620311 RepID=UPI001CF2C34E|nr:3' terminal RNA ribose 2'-O-methyltransferase Hen1 [Demequina sp. TMPB413]MCB2412410.1 3' terminal RNA ribose 2'-O-methyltransferase Hen1 [Demequina sp. TTPB684]UPU89506.1 3' terminal RNA ribose 2'-O-methyltransferase Hen1 [Demequina sp. TMPB413]
MILTITTTHTPATDLGFLLHKHPERAQSFDLSVGTAHVFYPEATDERCTVVLLLEVDALELARNSGRTTMDEFTLGQYVNDRPYAASSLLASAMKRVFSTAAAGTLKSNQALADSAIPLEIRIPALPCRGSSEFARELFEPLGWDVAAHAVQLDPEFPEWGDSRYLDLTLSGTLRLADALRQLYVLLPVLDDAKHYWVGDDEIDKLVRHGEGWLGEHPLRDAIARRYLAHQKGLVNQALDRLVESGGEDPDALPPESTPAEELPQPRARLAWTRRDAIVAELKALGVRSVADVGCGDGALLRPLLADPSFNRVIGTDVSATALARGARRLHVDGMSERQAQRLALIQSSATYRDKRLEGLDAVVLMEVIEHLDIDRLPALESAIFGHARPHHVIVSTPNREFNVRYDGMAEGVLRHPDHRWEFTRDEFTTWATSVWQNYGYRVSISGIGDADAVLGSPTQMAVFSRVDSADDAQDGVAA